MCREFRFTEEDIVKSRDGLDIKTLEMPKNLPRMFELLRDFPFMRKILPESAFSQTARPLILNCSHICCITTKLPLDSESVFLGGRVVERLWLKVTKLGISLQPWSISTFFIMRLNKLRGIGFSIKEKREIKQIENDLKKTFGVSSQETILFIFRISKSKPPTQRSLRVHWKTYTEIK